MAARTTPDPGRILALLWAAPARAGRSGLTVSAIVEAAIALADTAGTLDTVGMRQVAEHLGVGTMSLYTHVPGKAELTELMIDTCLGELYADLDEPTRQSDGWRGALRFIAGRHWWLYSTHPWLLGALGRRPTLGPHAVRQYEAELRPLDRLGLSDVEIDSVRSLVLTHVSGTASAHLALGRVRQESGQSDDEWWLATAPVLERVMVGIDLPLASRVGQASAEAYQGLADSAHELEFGISRILDGVAALIASRQPSPRRR